MKIAFFNWRDIKNPLAGGAEVYCHQVLKRLSKNHKVTLFTSTFRGSTPRETIDGIEHVRYGGRYSIYAKSFSCYNKHIRGKYDIVVESVNGVPFFTPLFSREPVVSFIHQLTRENWYSGIFLPAAVLGYYGEDLMLSLYRQRPAIVPSDSTRADLLGLGFRDVHVIHGAADIKRPDLKKEKVPTLLYLGRLTKSKRVSHAIEAYARVRKAFPQTRLWIAGSGPEEKTLKTLSSSLGVADSVSFLGRVSEEKKAELLTRSTVLLLPAVREGWGLVVLEANSCMTPAIGYDVPGLRDSIRDNVNGALVQDGDLAALSEMVRALLSDPVALGKLQSTSSEYAATFNWDRTAEQFEALFAKVLEAKR